MKKMGLLFLLVASLALPRARAAEQRPVVAVFDVQAKAFKLVQAARSLLTEVLAQEISLGGHFQVMPPGDVERILRLEKVESYKECYDEKCQIDLGRELPASKLLTTVILKLGKKCRVTASLYDLKRQTTDDTAKSVGACRQQGLIASLEKVAAELRTRQAARVGGQAGGAATSMREWIPEGTKLFGLNSEWAAFFTGDQQAKLAKATAATTKLSGKERSRRLALLAELQEGRPVVVHADMSNEAPEIRNFAAHIHQAALEVEALYQAQTGALEHRACVKLGSPIEQAVFFRNQGPWCESNKDPAACNACASLPKPNSGLYPQAFQAKKNFCTEVNKKKGLPDLSQPFAAVESKDGKNYAVPYTQKWPERMQRVAAHLRRAAKALGKNEPALKRYVVAAAKAFSDNDWFAADEAWAAMNDENSRWYLRIAPDEAYRDPCNYKAHFHATFGRVDQDFKFWSKRIERLVPLFEKRLASLIGQGYRPRKVKTQTSEFIEILFNAGDSRHALGATLGQSLPNWGKVASERRGRTISMTNLTTGPEAIEQAKQKYQSAFCSNSVFRYGFNKQQQVLDTYLFQIANKLGPHPGLKVNGKNLGGGLPWQIGSVLSVLHSRTVAATLIEVLREQKMIDAATAESSYASLLGDMTKFVAMGLWTPIGRPRPYSQVSAIQLGFLIDAGVLRWLPTKMAANGRDRGCFEVDTKAFRGALRKLVARVGGLLLDGDNGAIERFVNAYIRGQKVDEIQLSTLQSRYSKFPGLSSFYAVNF